MEVLNSSPKTIALSLALSNSGLKRAKIISDEQTEIIEVVNYVFVCSFIGLLGIIANIINIIIFYKQGFTSTVNMSFFSMAISDLGCLITLQWFCLCMNPLFENSDIPFVPREVQYLTGGLFHVSFSRITSWITAFVTIERCLGITVPLKVKQFITPTRTVVVLVVIYVVNIVAFAPEYLVLYLDWKFYEDKNKTLLGVTYKVNKGVAGMLIYIFTPILSMGSFLLVIIFTIVLVVKLREKSAWRKSATSDKTQSGSLSTRDKNTVRMVVVIACVLIICYTPGTIVAPVTVFEPDFNIIGYYHNAFMSVWSFPFIFQAVNSSINIIFYYRMSSNYRQNFLLLFSLSQQQNIGG